MVSTHYLEINPVISSEIPGANSNDRRALLTPAGALCMEKLLDPFHDSAVKLTGLPDGNTVPTVIQEIRQTVTVTAAGNDISVALLPRTIGPEAITCMKKQCLWSATNYYAASATPSFVQCSANGYVGWSSIGVNTAADTLVDIRLIPVGSPFYPDGNTAIYGTQVPVPSLLPAASGNRRLLGIGIEIHNTTAEIYRQGTITCYRKPVAYENQTALVAPYVVATGQPAFDSVGFTTNPITAGAPILASNLPAVSLTEAMAYPGTTQWNAADGAYLVGTMRDAAQHRLHPSDEQHYALQKGDAPFQASLTAAPQKADSLATFTLNLAGTDAVQPFARYGAAQAPPSYRTDFNTTGALLTGLSTQSTFTITLKAVWELAPVLGDPSGQSLVWMVNTPPPRDDNFLSLYQEVAARLPPAVPVGMNPNGEWFDMVMSLAKQALPFLSPIANAVVPGSGTIVAAATPLLSAGLNAMTGQWGTPKPVKTPRTKTPRPALKVKRSNSQPKVKLPAKLRPKTAKS